MVNIDNILESGYAVKGAFSDIFDSAIVGVTTDTEPKLVYSYNVMLHILVDSGHDYIEAESTLRSLCELRKEDIFVIYTNEHIT